MRKEWTLFLTFLKIGAFTFGGEPRQFPAKSGDGNHEFFHNL